MIDELTAVSSVFGVTIIGAVSFLWKLWRSRTALGESNIALQNRLDEAQKSNRRLQKAVDAHAMQSRRLNATLPTDIEGKHQLFHELMHLSDVAQKVQPHGLDYRGPTLSKEFCLTMANFIAKNHLIGDERYSCALRSVTSELLDRVMQSLLIKLDREEGQDGIDFSGDDILLIIREVNDLFDASCARRVLEAIDCCLAAKLIVAHTTDEKIGKDAFDIEVAESNADVQEALKVAGQVHAADPLPSWVYFPNYAISSAILQKVAYGDGTYLAYLKERGIDDFARDSGAVKLALKLWLLGGGEGEGRHEAIGRNPTFVRTWYVNIEQSGLSGQSLFAPHAPGEA